MMKNIFKLIQLSFLTIVLITISNILAYAQTDSTTISFTLPTHLDFSTPQQMYFTLMAVISSLVTILTGYLTIRFKFLQNINSKVWRVIIIATPLIGVVLKFGFNPDVSALVWMTITGLLGGTFAYDKLLKPSGLKSLPK